MKPDTSKDMETYELSLWESFKKKNTELFCTHFRYVLIRYGRKYKDKERLEDCIHNIFEGLIKKSKNDKLPTITVSPRAYLFKSLDYGYWKKEKCDKKEYPLSTLDPHLQRRFHQFPDEFQNPAQALENKDPIVSSAYSSLSFGYRKIILLCRIYGYSYKKAAKIMQLPTPTAAKSKLWRAMKKLKANMEQTNRMNCTALLL